MKLVIPAKAGIHLGLVNMDSRVRGNDERTSKPGFRMDYWGDRNREVDFVVRMGASVLVIEVKSGRAPSARAGLDAFVESFPTKRMLVVGGDGVSLEEFLTQPVRYWVRC